MATRDGKQRGYLLPEVAYGHPEICVKFNIPDTPEYRAAITKQVFFLTKWWAWERVEDPRPLEARSAFLRAISDTFQFLECGSDCVPGIFDIRIEDCILEIKRTEEGEWETVGDLSTCALPGEPGPPGEPGEPGPPGEPGAPGAPGEDCDCLEGCEGDLCRTVHGMSRILYEENFIPFLEAIRNDKIAEVPYNAVSYLEVWGLPFLEPEAFEIFEDVGLYFYNLEDPEFPGAIDGFIAFIHSFILPATTLHLYCNMEQSLAWTQLSYEAFLTALGGSLTSESSTELYQLWITIPLSALQERISRALYTTPVADCSEFDCNEEWCIHYDFTQEEGREGWEIGNGMVGGFGYQSEELEDILYIRRDEALTPNITRVRFHFFYDELINQGTGLWGGFDFGDTIIDSIDADGSSSGYIFDMPYDPAETPSGVRIVCTVGGDFGNRVYIDWAEFYGTGEPMLGDGEICVEE